MNGTGIRAATLIAAIVLSCVLSLPSTAPAVSSVSLSAAGEGKFLIEGAGVEQAAALQIDLYYDAAALTDPQVTAGSLISGAMMEVNASSPGALRMVIVRLTPVSGSGLIATVAFQQKGSGGSVQSLSAKLLDMNGVPLQVQAQISSSAAVSYQPDAGTSVASGSGGLPSGAGVQTANSGPEASETTSSGSLTAIMVGPAGGAGAPPATAKQSVAGEEQKTGPSDPEALDASKEDREGKGQPTDGAQDNFHEAGAKTREGSPIYAQKSVLDRFREYKGPRTAAALLSIFGYENMTGCRQEPPVAISDGLSVVKMLFVSTPGARTASDLAVMGARLISLKRSPDYTNAWIAELIPERGTYQASIALSQGKLRMIYPLVVSPRISVSPGRSGVSVDVYVDYYRRDRRMDLNNDGKMDYLDDYVFAANYLAFAGEKTKKKQERPLPGKDK